MDIRETHTTQNLILRKYNKLDAELLSKYLSDSDVTLNTETLPYQCSIQDAYNLIQKINDDFILKLNFHTPSQKRLSLNFSNIS